MCHVSAGRLRGGLALRAWERPLGRPASLLSPSNFACACLETIARTTRTRGHGTRHSRARRKSEKRRGEMSQSDFAAAPGGGHAAQQCRAGARLQWRATSHCCESCCECSSAWPGRASATAACAGSCYTRCTQPPRCVRLRTFSVFARPAVTLSKHPPDAKLSVGVGWFIRFCMRGNRATCPLAGKRCAWLFRSGVYASRA